MLSALENSDNDPIYGALGSQAHQCVSEGNKAARAASHRAKYYTMYINLPNQANEIVAVPGVRENYQSGSLPKHFFTNSVGQKELVGTNLLICLELKEKSEQIRVQSAVSSSKASRAKRFVPKR